MNKSADIFRFKRFSVVNERSAMKVNTDGVLLGALMTITPQDRRLLDVGTGTGTVALMVAQRIADGFPVKPGMTGCELGTMGDKPGMTGSELGTTGDKPRMTGCEPGTTRDKPGMTGCEPGTTGVKPGMTGCEPGTMGDKPGMTGCEPGTTRDKPGMTERVVEFQVEAIDIDEPSASEAAMNFKNSPWGDHLMVKHASLQEYAESLADDVRYDLIFSNPPYFDDSLEAPQERRNNARHTGSGLSYRELLEFSSEHLTEDGRFAVVLPTDQERPLIRHARMCGLHPFRVTRIRTVPRKAPSRMVVEFSRHRCQAPEENLLTIQEEGKYSQEYLSLTREFYLFA